MGRATIISETGQGLYTIKPIYETAYLDAQIIRLTSEIAQYTAQISNVDTELSTIQTEYENKQSELASAINVYRLGLNLNPEAADIAPVNALVVGLNEIYIRLAAKQREKAVYTLKKVSAEKRKTKLEAVKAEPVNQSAWCVTYTENLTGEVYTIEINGEPDQILVDSTNFFTNNKLCPILGHTVAGSLFNVALTPFWQKWKPTFRTGAITALDGNYADVALDAAVSHYQGLGINQSSTLSDVEISYLTCNGAAFTVGDKVVVAFTGQNWSTPKIIGFEDNPVECPSSGINVFCINSFFADQAWSIYDLDGGSPSIDLLYDSVSAKCGQAGSDNTILNFISGAFRIETHDYVQPTLIFKSSFDLSYSSGYTLRLLWDPPIYYTNDEDYNQDFFAIAFKSIDGLSPAISASGAGILSEASPSVWIGNEWDYLTFSKYYFVEPGQWVDIDNYVDGIIQIVIFQKTQGAATSYRMGARFNFKTFLGV